MSNPSEVSEIPPIDLDAEGSSAIGLYAAQLQWQTVHEAYQQQYIQSADAFVRDQVDDAVLSRYLGQNMALLRHQERQETLLRIAIATPAIAIPTYGASVAVGLGWGPSCIWFLPSFVGALAIAKFWR